MKKPVCLLLSLLLAAGISACGAAEKPAGTGKSAAASESSVPETTAAERPVINVITDPIPEDDAAGVSEAVSAGTPAADSSEPMSPGTPAAEPSETAPAGPPAASDGTYTITFAGDILMDPGYSAGAALTERGAEGCFSAEALALMRDADLFVVNNEFAYTNRGTAVSKQYNFRADPKNARILTDMGADLVTLGNNHTYDYGEEGLLDTLAALDQVGVPYIGAGLNQADAERAMIRTIGDFRISLLNAEIILFNANPPAQTAVGNKPGTFDSYRPELLYDAIRRAKAESDFCIVITHWGSEGKSTPNEKQLTVAKGAAEAGADLIIGGHPHVLQGISHLGNMPVCYSLGNYLFHSGTYDTGVIQAVFRPSEHRLETLRFVPMQCSNMKVSVLSGGEKERLLNYMRSLSPDVQIDDDGRILLP